MQIIIAEFLANDPYVNEPLAVHCLDFLSDLVAQEDSVRRPSILVISNI
jgi:hypothetical protein